MPPIKHVFVLMLENRSFDHLLGFSGLTGTDAASNRPTQVNGPPPGASNSWNAQSFPADRHAVDPMKDDPAHEFQDVLEQLCGSSAVYPNGGPYPPIHNHGFVSNFARHSKNSAPGEVMQGFEPSRLPVLSTLAKEFAVCDSWFCSIPGPTAPNRFFALGASSAGLDHSPTIFDTALWNTVDGFRYQHGSIFDAVRSFFFFFKRKLQWRIYAGNKIFTLAHALRGIHFWDISRYNDFAKDINASGYDAQFTWIEPNYGHVTSDFVGGNSQHPLDGVTGGEALIKQTYEALRNSPLWESSLLIITYDEHGGFYDHVAPPPATPPGDSPQFTGANSTGFLFDQYGPRVPAVIISPLIPRNLIDHRIYDHSSILATVERLFHFNPLTKRDANALDLKSLASLSSARTGTPSAIPLSAELEARHGDYRLDTLEIPTPPSTHENDPVEWIPSLPNFLYVVARTDQELPPANLPTEAHTANVRARVSGLRTCGQARDYIEEVRQKAVSAEATRR